MNSERNLVEVVGDEFVRRLKAGESPTIEEYEAKYPELADELRGFLEALRVVQRFGGSQFEKKAPPKLGKTGFPRIEDYEVIREIGRGGMGVVYEAIQIPLDRRVALKLIPDNMASDPTSLARFYREAKSAAALHHSNIVPVFDIGTSNGHHYYAMQFIQGKPLKDVIVKVKRLQSQQAKNQSVPADLDDASVAIASLVLDSESSKPSAAEPLRSGTKRNKTKPDSNSLLPDYVVPQDTMSGTSANRELSKVHTHADTSPAALEDTAVTGKLRRSFYRKVALIGRQVALGLDYAHQNGVIHRDIKPANLMMDLDGNVWIADFGLAKTEEEDLTRTGDIVGTLRYMSPERFNGRCDASGDIYSLGMTLYELLVLKPCYGQTNYPELIDAISNRDPVNLRVIDPAVPADLQTIILKAISKEPGRRYKSASTFADDLGRFIDGRPIHAREATYLEYISSWARRNPASATLAVSLLATLVIGFLVSTYTAIRFRTMAKRQVELTNEQRVLTVNQTRLAQENAQSLYYAEMQKAFEISESPSGLESVKRFVEKWKPNSKSLAKVGWEWHWLNSFCHQSELKFNIKDVGADGPITSVEWNPDGLGLLWAAMNHENAFVSYFDSGNHVRIKQDSSWIHSSRFSPDGQTVALSCEKGARLSIWDWKTNRLLKTMEVDGHVGDSTFAPNGRTIAFIARSTEDRRRIEVWNLDSGKRQFEIIDNLQGSPRSVGFSHDGKYLAAFGDIDREMYVQCWNASDGTRVGRKRVEGIRGRRLHWHPFKNIIAATYGKRTVATWDVESDVFKKVLDSDETYVNVKWNPTGQYMAVSSFGHLLKIWDNDNQKDVMDLVGHSGSLRGISWHPTRKVLVSAGEDEVINFWDVTRPAVRTRLKHSGKFKGHRCQVFWRRDSNAIAFSGDGATEVWERQDVVGGYKKIATVRGMAVGWSNDGKFFATKNHNKIQVWNQDLKTLQFSHECEYKNIACVWNSTRPQLIVANHGELPNRPTYCKVYVIDATREEETFAYKKFEGFFESVVVHPSGKQFITLSGEIIKTFDLATRKFVKEFSLQDRNLYTAAFNADGSRLVASGDAQKVQVFETASYQPTHEYLGHTARVLTSDWSDTNSRIATGGEDGRVIVWDTTTGTEAVSMTLNSEARSLAWSPDGYQLAAIDSAGSLTIWDAERSISGKLEQESFDPRQMPDWSKALAAAEGLSSRETGSQNKSLTPLKGLFGKALSQAEISQLPGVYERLPVENEWHRGVLRIKNGDYFWENETGSRWSLIPDFENGILKKAPGTPYYETDDGKVLTLRTMNDEVIGFQHKFDFFHKVRRQK